jgi:hypothetical protein
MAFHVPFEHRQRAQPIYIGFDLPPRRIRKRNWTGFVGFLMGIAGLFTVGVLSPLALLISLFGLRKGPRGFAITGVVLGLIGSMMIGSIVAATSLHRQQVHERRMSKQNQVKVVETEKTLKTAVLEFEEYAGDHDGYLPEPITANMLSIKYMDAWGQSLRFDDEKSHAVLRSAGADRKFDSRDDVTVRLQGNIDRDQSLPVN